MFFSATFPSCLGLLATVYSGDSDPWLEQLLRVSCRNLAIEFVIITAVKNSRLKCQCCQGG